MASVEWETPQVFFDKLNAEFGFEIDVCANALNTKCAKYFSIKNNSLFQKWHGICWMNPPYSKDIFKWVAKAWESAQDGSTVIALLQGRSNDTKWWHKYIMRSSEIRFIKDRLHFGLDGKFNRANISSIIVVFQPYCQGPPVVSSIDTRGIHLTSKLS